MLSFMTYLHKKDLYAAQLRHRVKIRSLLLAFLSDKHCLDCGENDPIVLDFDHMNPDTKFKKVSKMLSGHYGWDTILKEIEKCQIRCANCHRRKTYRQFNFAGKTSPRSLMDKTSDF